LDARGNVTPVGRPAGRLNLIDRLAGVILMATNPTQQPPTPSMVKVLLWTLLWLVMWFWAIVGSLCVVLAIVSFFVDLSPFVSLNLFSGEEARTTQQKVTFLVANAVIACIGVGFLWLYRRGYLKDPL
jgi:hypothetical protein